LGVLLLLLLLLAAAAGCVRKGQTKSREPQQHNLTSTIDNTINDEK